jgi:hypothetical protein
VEEIQVVNYTFITEDGTFKMDYADYLKNDELMLKVNAPPSERKRIIMARTIVSYPLAILDRDKTKADAVAGLEYMIDENPLRFFSPSFIRGGGALDFLNDSKTDVKLLIAGNRRGKTAHGVVDILLDAVPCDPSWEIFTQCGVKYRPFSGGLHCGYATSDWKVMQRVLWPEIRKWIPKAQLGAYDPRRPKYREISWMIAPEIVLECGSRFFFFVYEQKQQAFEGQALHRWYWDEQPEEAKWDGADERLRTLKGRHVHGLTPHKVDGRPDTGARSWIHSMVKGQNTRGHSVRSYSIGPDDVPDWVYPEVEKRKSYEKWITIPKATKNLKAEREGRSRYFGEFHESSGLVYDEFSPEIHIIDDFQIPSEWTRYRAIDHGVNNPTAALCGAVMPSSHVVLFREYYNSGLTVFENCKRIIAACGNEIRKTGTVSQKTGLMFNRSEEVFKESIFRFTVLDKRSRNTTDAGLGFTIGQLYAFGGIRTVDASGMDDDTAIPIVKELMRFDDSLHNPITGKMGSPRLFVFRSLANFIREITNFAMQEYKNARTEAKNNLKERPITKDNHLMDALKYLAQIPLRYVDGVWSRTNGEEDEDEEERDPSPRRVVDRITGY